MIKNIKDFPRLDLIQQYENGKEIIRLCDEGIQEAEKIIRLLSIDLDKACEYEKQEIVKDIITCNIHLTICEKSRRVVENELKHLTPLFN